MQLVVCSILSNLKELQRLMATRVMNIVWHEQDSTETFDISTKAKETKVFKGMIRDLIKSEDLTDIGVFDAELLLKKKYLLLNDEDFQQFRSLHTNIRFRSENQPFIISDEWPNGLAHDLNI